MSVMRRITAVGVAATLATGLMPAGGLPASASSLEWATRSAGSPNELLAATTFAEIFPADTSAHLDPAEVFGPEVLGRVAPGSTYEQIVHEYTLDDLFDDQTIRDLANRLTLGEAGDSRQSRVVWVCGGVLECGFKFTNNESKVIANGALGGGGAAAQLACNMIPNPVIQAGCKVSSAAVTTSAITVATIVLANPRLCLFYRPNLAPVGLAWATVSC